MIRSLPTRPIFLHLQLFFALITCSPAYEIKQNTIPPEYYLFLLNLRVRSIFLTPTNWLHTFGQRRQPQSRHLNLPPINENTAVCYSKCDTSKLRRSDKPYAPMRWNNKLYDANPLHILSCEMK